MGHSKTLRHTEANPNAFSSSRDLGKYSVGLIKIDLSLELPALKLELSFCLGLWKLKEVDIMIS